MRNTCKILLTSVSPFFEKNTEEVLGTKLMFIHPPYCLNKFYQHSTDSSKKVLIVPLLTNNLIKKVRTSTHAITLKLWQKLSQNLRNVE